MAHEHAGTTKYMSIVAGVPFDMVACLCQTAMYQVAVFPPFRDMAAEATHQVRAEVEASGDGAARLR